MFRIEVGLRVIGSGLKVVHAISHCQVNCGNI